jgi:hypothetical protein
MFNAIHRRFNRMLGFIDDGQTITRFIKGKPRMHYGVRVTFRPTPSIDHSVVEKKIRKLQTLGKPEQAERLIYETIASRIVEWEFLDEDDKVVEGCPPVSVEQIMRAVPALQDRLILLVYSQNEGGDPDPLEPKADTSSAEEKSNENLGN